MGVSAEPDDARCPACGSLRTAKLVSRPGRFRTEDGRIEEVADRLDAMDDDASPSAVREAMREVGRALDDDLSDELESTFEEDSEGGE